MVFFTQITMEAAEDPEFLDAMREARIKGALVGVESVTPEGLKDVYKGFNLPATSSSSGCGRSAQHGVHVLGSFIFGLPSDTPADVRRHGGAGREGRHHVRAVRDADAVPGHGGFREVGKARSATDAEAVDGMPLTRHWLIPAATGGRRSTRRIR